MVYIHLCVNVHIIGIVEEGVEAEPNCQVMVMVALYLLVISVLRSFAKYNRTL